MPRVAHDDFMTQLGMNNGNLVVATVRENPTDSEISHLAGKQVTVLYGHQYEARYVYIADPTRPEETCEVRVHRSDLVIPKGSRIYRPPKPFVSPSLRRRWK